MLTFKAIIIPSEQKGDKTYNVKIRLTYKRQVRKIATSIFVKKCDLTKSYKIKNPDILKQADKLIRDYQATCAKFQIELHDYTIDEILNLIKEEKTRIKSVDFIRFSIKWTETTSCKGVKNYKTAIKSFIAYIGKEELDINQITKDMLIGFKDYLIRRREAQVELMRKQGKRIPSNRMVSLYLGSIRHLFNLAKKQYNDYEKGIILVKNSPFENFDMPKQEITRKRALDADTIRKILELPYKRKANGQERTCTYNLAKDCFILSFCLIGMNSADLYSATEITDGTIVYERKKTTDRRSDKALMKVRILPQVQQLVKKHFDQTGKKVFGFYHSYSSATNFNRAINNGLKEIGEILGIEDLEYYAARHSWATLAINKVGIDKYTVHSALNHLDESMKVTDIYIERDFEIENRANEKVLNYVFAK